MGGVRKKFVGIRFVALFGLVGLLLSLAGVAQGTAASPEAVPLVPSNVAKGSLAEATGLAEKGRLDQALVELDELAKVEPEGAGVERLRGMILYQKDRLAEAEAAFARAVTQDGTDRESLQMRGITLYRLGRPEEAIGFLEKAEGLGTSVPTSSPAGAAQAGGIGAIEAEGVSGGNGGDGINRGNGINRINADPHYVLGLCYTDAKRYDDARRAFAEQFGFGADSAEGYLVTARMFLRREFADEAQRFAQKALDIDARLPLAHQLLGEIALAKADLPVAVKELEAEEKLNPVNGALYDRLGDAYIRDGRYEEARVALNKALLLEPNATGPYILLGEALVRLGQPIQALHYLDRAAAMDPQNYVTHNILGQAYRAVGRMEDAKREYKLAVEIQHRTDPKPAKADPVKQEPGTNPDGPVGTKPAGSK